MPDRPILPAAGQADERARHRRPLLAAGAIAALLAVAGGLALVRPDEIVAATYRSVALEPSRQTHADVAVSQSPLDRRHVRLSRTAPSDAGALRDVFQPGDRISIAGRDGNARHIDVIDVRELPATDGQLPDEPALAVVTGKVVGEAGREQIVRFLVEAPAAAAPADRSGSPAQQPRQL